MLTPLVPLDLPTNPDLNSLSQWTTARAMAFALKRISMASTKTSIVLVSKLLNDSKNDKFDQRKLSFVLAFPSFWPAYHSQSVIILGCAVHIGDQK